MVNVNSKSKLEVAVVGCGIAGLTAAIALRQHPLINVTIYEKATELKEIGASIALGPNGLRTLERLGLHNAISDEVAFRGPSGIPMIYRHWATNEVIGTDQHENVNERSHHTARYHRAHLHQALLENVPREIIHLNKKIQNVEISPDTVELRFRDGTSATADLVIGADGIRSGVREVFVPEFPLKWSGWTAIRAIFDTSIVENIPDLPKDSTHWWGPSTAFFSSRLGKGKFAIVGGLQEDPDDPNAILGQVSWDDAASSTLLRERYHGWNPVVKALIEAAPPDSLHFHPNLSCSASLDSWVFGDRVVLIGDAAHAHGGAHATGGSIAIDDAYALYLSLLSILPPTATDKPSGSQLREALKLYEATRKPHTDRLLAKVHVANTAKARKIRSGNVDSDAELRERASKGSDTTWLHEHDVVKAFEETLKKTQLAEQQSLDVGEFSSRL